MMQLTYKMESFEGPLDLLLDLIHKNKMDILDIQISVIFEQYMAHLERMRQMDMEIAGEFIVMASELMLIKSNMLLPREEETEEDPRARLAQALLAYQQAKAAADYLAEQYGLFGGRMTKDTDEIPADTQLENQDVRLLERTLMRLLRKKERDLTPAYGNDHSYHKKSDRAGFRKNQGCGKSAIQKGNHILCQPLR